MCLYVYSALVLLANDSPLRLVGCVGGLRELLGGGGQPLLGALQVLLEELDAAVQGGDLALGLQGDSQIRNYNKFKHFVKLMLGGNSGHSVTKSNIGESRGILKTKPSGQTRTLSRYEYLSRSS